MGYIILQRAMFERQDYLKQKFCHNMAWIDLIFLANWKKTSFYIRGIRVEVPRGTLAWSREKLGKRWGWSTNRVNRFLKSLEIDRQVKQQKSHIITLISLVNYDKYQNIGMTNGATNSMTNELTDGVHQKELKTLKNGRSPNFYQNSFENTGAPPLGLRQPDGTIKYKP